MLSFSILSSSLQFKAKWLHCMFHVVEIRRNIQWAMFLETSITKKTKFIGYSWNYGKTVNEAKFDGIPKCGKNGWEVAGKKLNSSIGEMWCKPMWSCDKSFFLNIFAIRNSSSRCSPYLKCQLSRFRKPKYSAHHFSSVAKSRHFLAMKHLYYKCQICPYKTILILLFHSSNHAADYCNEVGNPICAQFVSPLI